MVVSLGALKVDSLVAQNHVTYDTDIEKHQSVSPNADDSVSHREAIIAASPLTPNQVHYDTLIRQAFKEQGVDLNYVTFEDDVKSAYTKVRFTKSDRTEYAVEGGGSRDSFC